MATITINVPINGNDKRSQGWIENVSEHIDAGDGVEFVDEADGTTPVGVGHISLDSAGYVSFYGKGYTSAAAVSVNFTAGGFHAVNGIHGIRKEGTATGLGIKVKV